MSHGAEQRPWMVERTRDEITAVRHYYRSPELRVGALVMLTREIPDIVAFGAGRVGKLIKIEEVLHRGDLELSIQFPHMWRLARARLQDVTTP